MKKHLIKFEQNMNGRDLRICFVLSDRVDSGQRREELQQLRQRSVCGGVTVLRPRGEGPAPEQPLPCPADAMEQPLPCPAEAPEQPVLYLADAPETLHALLRRGLPAAAYRHGGNRGEDFTEAVCLLEEPQEIDEDSYVKIYQRLTGGPWTIAVTPRLWIREMVPEDLDALYVLYDDPAARRFLEPLREDRRQEAQLLRAYIDKIYGLYGYGMWAVCDRQSSELIGRIGFEPYHKGAQAVEMGYLIRRDHRRQGLAREAAVAVLRFADDYLDFPAVCARTAADNAASIALLKSLGFHESAPVDESGASRENGTTPGNGPVDESGPGDIRCYIRQ